MSICNSYRKEESPICTCLIPQQETDYFPTPELVLTTDAKMCTKEKKFHQHTIKSLVKDNPDTVYESLLGIAQANKNLAVLEGHCIIMRRDHKSMRGKVKIIGGGGAGIEPADAYYVGKGMLTTAVVGGIFAAPPANEILIAIRELAADNFNGILLLIKNYVGDKINFKLAMDQALNENISVKMLVIGDDIYDHIPARHGRKGMAGSVLAYKIIGAMAEHGKTLEEICVDYNSKIANNLATVSVTMTPCTHYTCNSFNHFIGTQEVVLGLGIYGKGGAKKIQLTNLKDVVSVILKEIISFLKYDTPENEVIVLVNNLGGTTKLEEAVIANEVLVQLNKMNFRIAQTYLGTFMSSLSSQGFSVSILGVNFKEIIAFLKAPTLAPGWPVTDLEDSTEHDSDYLANTVTPSCSHDLLNDVKFESTINGPILSEKATAALRQIALFAAEALISCEMQLNIIDTEAGDGDTGTVLKRAADVLKARLIDNKMDLKNPSKFLLQLSEICCRHMGGLSGALYSIFFESAAKTFQDSTEITPELCCTAFKDAVKTLKCYSNAELGDRTILDALSPAADSFECAIRNGKNLTKAVHLAATTCEFKSEETKRLKPGTLQHMNINQAVLYADAGTHAATIWLRAVSEGLRLHYPTQSFETDIPLHHPGIFLWKFLNEEETNCLFENELSSQELLFFFEKKMTSDEYNLMILLSETVKFCRHRILKSNDTPNNSRKKMSSMVGTVYYTHQYFVASLWRTPAEVYFYFRESILLQSVESPPISMEIFEPDDAKNAVIFFYETYVRNLPIIRILHQPHYKLHLQLKDDKLLRDQTVFGKESRKKGLRLG